MYEPGALLRCKKVLEEKNIYVAGVDYNSFYVNSAEKAIKENKLESLIQVECKSVYDLPKTPPKKRPGQQEKEFFDAAYFSGCISLLPDPPAALDAVSSLVKPGGYIYITQTYQRTNVPLLKYFKPLMKYFLSIDFGELVMVEEVEDKLWKGCSSKLKVLEHKVIPGSVDNMFQAAYLTVMKKED